jgi:hypothetical protein
MKFTEEKLEKAFTELMGQEGMSGFQFWNLTLKHWIKSYYAFFKSKGVVNE